MTRINSLQRFVFPLLVVVLSASQLGCNSSQPRGVTFTNFSESWLNVNYFVEVLEQDELSDTIELVSANTIQVPPGETVNYRLTRNSNYRKDGSQLVHIRVLPVTPSWETVEKEYWMELLTHPPVTIVATGMPDRISFMTGNGAIALIPSQDFRQRQFNHKTLEEILAHEKALENDAELQKSSQSNASEADK